MTNQFMGRVRLTIVTDGVSAVWKAGPSGSLAIYFTAPFSNDSSQSLVTVSIYNLSQQSLDFIRSGSKVLLEAGYGDDIGVISEGTISYVYPRTSEGTGDVKTSFVFMEGEDYTKKGAVTLSLAPGITADEVIRRIAQAAGITISEMNLPKPKTYGDGYSIDGAPMDEIGQIVQEAGAAVYYKRGRLVINRVQDSKDTPIIYDAAHGLIGYPQPLDWSADSQVSGYSVELLMNHRITVGSAIQLNSKYGKGGVYHFRSGQHSFDGTRFRTTGEVI